MYTLEIVKDLKQTRKDGPVLPDGMFQTETRVSFSKAIFDASFRISRPFFGKLMKLICANSRHDSGQINQV